ncbi:hypothetical protein [Paenibacillus camelliae]|uniref:hypothetical protein n=1 Tax=Paenibacillus camelliae TaxID=512410 RepID=UPI00203C1160|nr:hypothetical protein [Paenibacillus camelliae]MCM3633681.1 hypothetical protein [Paenibacillus camelliae]
MKIFLQRLLWLIVLCAMFWGITELLFYVTYTFGYDINPVYITLITLLLMAIYTAVIWFGFRGKLWYVSLLSLLLCPIAYVIMLLAFGSMTAIEGDDYSVGFYGITTFVYNAMCLLIGTLIGNSLLLYDRTRR